MNSNNCKAIFLLFLLALLIPSGIAARQLPSDDASNSKGRMAKTEKVNAAAALTTDAQQGHISNGKLNPNHPTIGNKHPGGPYNNPKPGHCSHYRLPYCPPDATP